jgi:hypothetical protein
MYSFWAALSVLPAPPESGGVFAHGTVATCSTQAFFANGTAGIVLYIGDIEHLLLAKNTIQHPRRSY